MITRLRSLLLSPLFWLTMLALPFGSPAAAAAAAAAAVPPCHHAQAMVHMASVQKAEAPAAMHARSCADHGRHANCSSCPGCCAGVALAAPALPALPDAGPAFVAIPFRAGHIPSVDPALLERPPRTSFA